MRPHNDSRTDFIFRSHRASYYDSPIGVIRFIRVEGDAIVGSQKGKEVRVLLEECTPMSGVPRD